MLDADSQVRHLGISFVFRQVDEVFISWFHVNLLVCFLCYLYIFLKCQCSSRIVICQASHFCKNTPLNIRGVCKVLAR